MSTETKEKKAGEKPVKVDSKPARVRSMMAIAIKSKMVARCRSSHLLGPSSMARKLSLVPSTFLVNCNGRAIAV